MVGFIERQQIHLFILYMFLNQELWVLGIQQRLKQTSHLPCELFDPVDEAELQEILRDTRNKIMLINLKAFVTWTNS